MKCYSFRFSARKKAERFSIFTLLGKQLNFKHENPFEIPENFYMLKVNNKGTRKRCETCSKLTKTTEPCPKIMSSW